MEKMKKMTALLAAALTALSAVGCGKVDNAENDKDTAKAAVSQTVTETAAAEAASPDEIPVSGKKAPLVYIKDGCEDAVRYTPSDEEMNALAALALRQYNAITARNAEEYHDTLNLEKLYGGADITALLKECIADSGEDVCLRVMYPGLKVLGDTAAVNNEGSVYLSEPENTDEAISAAGKVLSSALDGFSAEKVRKIDEYFEDINGMERSPESNYYLEMPFERFEKIGEDAVCIKALKASAEKDGGKYIEFELFAVADEFTIPLKNVCGWIKDGSFGVNIGNVEDAQYDADTGRYDMKYIEFEPAAEEMDTLTQLAVKQYNAALEKNAEEYLAALNMNGLFAGADTETVIKNTAHTWDKTACELSVSGGLALLWDIAGAENDRPGSVKERLEAVSAAAGSVSADTLDRLSGSGDMMSSYFCRFAPDAKPVSGSAGLKTKITGAVERDGVRYISFRLTANDGGSTTDLGEVYGWIKNSESGVYDNILGRRIQDTAYSIFEIYFKDDAGCAVSEEQADSAVRLAAEQYNAILAGDAEKYLETAGYDVLFDGGEYFNKKENSREHDGNGAYGEIMKVERDILYDIMELSGEDMTLAEAYAYLNADRLGSYSAEDVFYAEGISSSFYETRYTDGSVFKPLGENYTYTYRLISSEEKDSGIYFKLEVCFSDGGESFCLPAVYGWVKNGVTGTYIGTVDKKYYLEDEYIYDTEENYTVSDDEICDEDEEEAEEDGEEPV